MNQGAYLLAVRGINEVTPRLVVRVQELETGVLVHGTHTNLVPLISNAHGTELQGRDMDTGIGGQLAVDAQLGLGLRSGLPDGFDRLLLSSH